jgi:L-alanine-DL-glutamate epimerase-like enolase superfamily enzyme
MRITAVRAVQPRTPNDPSGWRGALGQVLVVVDTDSGVRGLGVGGGGAAAIPVIENVLRPLLLGEDAHEVEALWARMYAATLPFGRKGLAIMAISGVDLALWDARGKAAGRSVAALLSDTARRRLPCYATTSRPLEAVARGFRTVKIPIGPRPATVEAATALVAETRAALGPDVALLTDAGMQWDLDMSLRAAERFAEYGVGWLEEPLPADDLAGYGELCRRSPVPIAGGEHEFTVQGFQELAARGAHAIWQPDVCWTGGLTQLRAIYALAGRSGIRVCPHRGSEVWALHAIAALDPEPLAESGRPWLTWLHGQPPIVDGFVEVPERPGFGVEVAPDLLAD